MPAFDHRGLKKWFLNEKREFPWREDTTPYSVWVSEVMLQQTQASVVKGYYERWMKLFPTVRHLAQASLDEVIKAWEGLGYYSRARNLHEGAKYVAAHFDGELPSSEAELKKIKGLGPYTVGAIRSFAFHQRSAAVDGNVIRVLARYFMVEEDVAKTATLKRIQSLAEEALPQEEPWVVSEALIELGATICGRKPKCSECPLKKSCKAYANGLAESLPWKSSKIKTEYMYRAVPILLWDGQVLVRRCEKGEIMRDLHEFPYFDTDKKGVSNKMLGEMVQQAFGLEVGVGETLPKVAHSFTRFQVDLSPVRFFCRWASAVQGYSWKSFTKLEKLAFSSGHRRIYHSLRSNFYQSLDL